MKTVRFEGYEQARAMMNDFCEYLPDEKDSEVIRIFDV